MIVSGEWRLGGYSSINTPHHILRVKNEQQPVYDKKTFKKTPPTNNKVQSSSNPKHLITMLRMIFVMYYYFVNENCYYGQLLTIGL